MWKKLSCVSRIVFRTANRYHSSRRGAARRDGRYSRFLCLVVMRAFTIVKNGMFPRRGFWKINPGPCRERVSGKPSTQKRRARFIWTFAPGSRTSKARECLLFPADRLDYAEMSTSVHSRNLVLAKYKYITASVKNCMQCWMTREGVKNYKQWLTSYNTKYKPVNCNNYIQLILKLQKLFYINLQISDRKNL